MKVLKDADDLFLAMNRKRQEYGRIVSNMVRATGAFAMRTSAWTPRRPRSGIFCGRSPSSGNH